MSTRNVPIDRNQPLLLSPGKESKLHIHSALVLEMKARMEQEEARKK